MKQFLFVLGQDLRRTLLSWKFLAAVLGLVAVDMFSLFDEYRFFTSTTSILYFQLLLRYRDFYIVFLLFSALPGATLFCEDWDNRYIRFAVLRSSKSIYAISKVIACFFAAVLVVFLSGWLMVLILSGRFEWFSPNDLKNSYGDFQILITPERVFLYYSLAFLCRGFCGGFLSVVALWFSTKVTNMFVTLATPMLAYYLIGTLSMASRIVPSNLLISHMTMGQMSTGSLGISLLLVFGGFSLLAALFGTLFVRSCNRRIIHG